MKKNLLFAAIAAMVLSSCADSKTFKKSDGTEFTAQPYGWMDKEKAIEGVEYEVNTGNIICSVIFSETIVAPVLLTGLELWEPVSYVEPNNKD